MFSGQFPDITPAQIIAIVGSVIGAAIAFGVHVTKEQQDAILAVTGAVAAVLIGSDAHLRGQRAQAHATRYAADRAAGVALDQKGAAIDQTNAAQAPGGQAPANPA